jgi:hydrogenase small subunit
MTENGSWLMPELAARGVSRREFLRFCATTASVLALPDSYAPRIAAAIENAEKPILVWLEFQDCAGNTESFLRSSRPTVAEIILDTLSVDYHETIMAAAGHQAEQNLEQVAREKRGQFLAVVEGSIPTGENGAYCTIGGRSALQIVREVCPNAAATIAIGTCAAFGGIPAAAPNPTGAVGVADAVPGLQNLINLSACPANAENLTALLVYYLTFSRWPQLDHYRRPLFAYGKLIHDACERRAHYDAGQYVEMWGDEGHRAGYCLYKMGC